MVNDDATCPRHPVIREWHIWRPSCTYCDGGWTALPHLGTILQGLDEAEQEETA